MAEVRDELLVPAPSPGPAQWDGARSAWDQPAGTLLGRPMSRRAVALGATATAALVVVGVVVATSGRTAPVGSLAQLDATLLASTDGSASVLQVTLNGDAVEVNPVAGLVPTTLPAPDGRARAVLEQAPDGWNLAVHMVDPPVVRAVTVDDGDEYPLAWSPDGRYLVYAHRRLMGDGRTRQHRLLVHDLVADSSWRLTSFESGDLPGAAWSPDGTRIAFTADVRGAAEVFVVDFDGANLRRVSRHPAADVDPAWSPDGDRLAFVSRRGNAVDLYTVRSDGSNLRQITQSAEEERTPVWISASVIVFVAGTENDADLWAVDTYTGQTRRLTRQRGLRAVMTLRNPRPVWVDRLRIRPRPPLGSPGQHLRFSVDATQENGDPLPSQSLPVHWRIADPTVATIGDSGWVRLLRPGQVTLVATAAGWRADTLTLESVPLTEGRQEPVFSENWMLGIRDDRWRVFGDPEPYTRPGLGPHGTGVFVNHGDEFFASGAVTRDRFPLGQGITVEVEGRIAFTGKHHQEFGIALYDTEHVDSLLATGAPALVELRIRGPAGDQRAEAALVTPRGRAVIPLPGRLGTWRTYAVQIQPRGIVDLIVDGELFWSADPLEKVPDDAYVGLGFQSFETEIAHGPVRVYVPARYVIGEAGTAPGAAR